MSAFRYLNLPDANVNMWVKFLSRHSEVFNIYTKYLSCLVYSCCVIELLPFTCHAFVVLHLGMRTGSTLED